MDAERWQRVQSILHAAFERPRSERAEFLAKVCGSDRNLRQAIEEFLAADQDASGFLETSKKQAESPHLEEEAEGSLIGAYRILRVLGRGGMGVVYLAERADEEFDRLVAIKVILPGQDPEPLLRRLRQERQILAGLEHPNIARLIDGGRTPTGGPYLVMEFVEGQRIDEYCDQRRLSTAARIDLFLTVCDAVQYAHQNLVVHRDLKPSNLLVTPEGVPKLLDFGIAKPLDAERFPAAIEGTETGLRPMTPSYASPEQILGKAITTGSDVYSLGVMLYEILSGRRPHQLSGLSPTERIEILVKDEPERPSQAVIGSCGTGQPEPVTDLSSTDAAQARGTTARQLKRELAGDLDQIVLKSLRKDPNRRYRSVGELADDLRRSRRGLPVQARPETFGYVAGKFVRRHRLGVAVALGFALVVSAFSVNTAHQATRLKEERDRAALERDKAEVVADFLASIFEASGQDDGLPSETTARELLRRGAERAESELGDQPQLLVQVLITIAAVYNSIGLPEESVSLGRRAVTVGEQVFDSADPAMARALLAVAVGLRLSSDVDESEALFRRALAICEATPNHPCFVESLRGLSGLLSIGRSDYQAALPLLLRSLEITESQDEPNPEVLQSVVSDLGLLYLSIGDFDSAEEMLLKSIDLQERSESAGTGGFARSLNNLALLYHEKGDLQRALPLYQRAFDLKQQIDPEGPSLAATAYNLGFLQRSLGQWERSEASLRRAQEISDAAFGSSSRASAKIISARSVLRLHQGDGSGALDLAQRAVVMMEAELGPDHDWTAGCLRVLAETQFVLGDLEQAEVNLARAATIRTAIHGDQHRSRAVFLFAQARIQAARGDFERAQEYARRLEGLWTRLIELGAEDRDTRYGHLSALVLLSELDPHGGDVARPEFQRLRTAMAELDQVAFGSLRTEEQWIHARALSLLDRPEEARAEIEQLRQLGFRALDFVRWSDERYGTL